MSLVISSRSAALLVLLVTFKIIVLRTQNYFGDLLSGFLDAKLYETWTNTPKITIKGLSTKYTENRARCGTGAASAINEIRRNNKILSLFRHFVHFFLLVTSVVALL